MQRPSTSSRPRPDGEVTPIGTALSAFLKANKLHAAAKHPLLDRAWNRIVGPEFVKQTRVLAFRRGTLEIGVESSALMNEIRFHQAALLADLQREVQRPAIMRISFSLISAQHKNGEASEQT